MDICMMCGAGKCITLKVTWWRYNYDIMISSSEAVHLQNIRVVSLCLKILSGWNKSVAFWNFIFRSMITNHFDLAPAPSSKRLQKYTGAYYETRLHYYDQSVNMWIISNAVIIIHDLLFIFKCMLLLANFIDILFFMSHRDCSTIFTYKYS